MHIRNLLVVAAFGFSAQAFAAGVDYCAAADPNPAGGVNLRNRCQHPINVTYCVENPRSSFDCGKGRGYGTKTLGPNASEFIPFYGSDGGGHVRTATCEYPKMATGWSGPYSSFECR